MNRKEFRKIIEPEIESCKSIDEIDQFDFIEDSDLKHKLIKSYRETIFVKNIIKKLFLQYRDPHPFNEILIIHYASIYEAIIDYSLEKYYSNHIKELLEEITLAKVPIKKNIKIIDSSDDTSELFICKEKKLTKNLFQVKFEKRIKKAVELRIIESHMQKELTELYDYRNHIHILKATSEDVEYTKKLVKNYCREKSLLNFCITMKNSLIKAV